MSDTKEVIYTPEYFVYKHVCPFVTEGSVRLPVKKYFNNIPEENIDDKAIAFRTPDNEIIFIIGNYDDSEKQLSLKVGEDFYNLKMAPKSFNTIKI